MGSENVHGETMTEGTVIFHDLNMGISPYQV